MTNNLKQYEKDESQNIRRIMESMNKLHAEMGGRDHRSERIALLKCMAILNKELQRSIAE